LEPKISDGLLASRLYASPTSLAAIANANIQQKRGWSQYLQTKTMILAPGTFNSILKQAVLKK
jgi:hypothetical protein